MGRLIVPQRGQPLDVSYVYDIVSAVNEIADRVATTGNGILTLTPESGVPQTTATSKMTVFAKTHFLGASKKVAAGEQVSFSVPFKSNFTTPPIVVATPFDTEQTTAGQSISLVITSVTTTDVSFIARYNVEGITSTKVNVLAIGIVQG